MQTLAEAARRLAAGSTTSEQLTEECLTRIADPAGEGQRAFVSVDADGARGAARAMDGLRRTGSEPSPWAGIPVSVKDVFDIRGQVTRAGSRALEPPPAACDAAAVARWRAAGLVLIGRTNMTEFAYSGLGINPHHGTPANPWDRCTRRIPGGSSSGAAISITDGMAFGALATDTGGSCRIPAALCGCAGFKPTQGRVSRDGTVPLSGSLDTVGVLAPSIACVAALDMLLSGRAAAPLRALTTPPRLAIPRNYMFDDADTTVRAAFERLIARLSDAGADLREMTIPALDAITEMNAGGGFAAAEAYAWHHELMAERGSSYDARIRTRIARGAALSARDLIVLGERRARLIAAVTETLEGFGGFLCPTTPVIAPPLAELDDEAEYGRVNLLMLRNPTVVNLLDGCAASVPMHIAGEPPSGAMVAGLNGADAAVLSIAAWIEERA